MHISATIRFATTLTRLTSKVQFIPKHEPVKPDEIKSLQEFLTQKPKILVLTGAGISTESGIPDYRSEGVGMYARSNRRPVQFMDFVKNPDIRRRYWARNFVAWPGFSGIEPNTTHNTLARLEREGRVLGIVTQNVDRLHSKAGSKEVVEIHGSGYTVGCLSCKYEIDRHEFQNILSTLNPAFANAPDMIRPDGDVDIPQEYEDNFKIPPCPECGGNLKPKIVFFGDNVPKDTIMKVVRMVCNSDGLLVLGSSLLVFSGYRIVLQTKELGLPVAIVNIGPTRADSLADLRLNARCGEVVPKLFTYN